MQPTVGDPNDLLLQLLPRDAHVHRATSSSRPGSTLEPPRVAVPAGHPDRRASTKVDPEELDTRPAGARHADRGPAPPRLRADPDRAERAGQQRAQGATAGRESATATQLPLRLAALGVLTVVVQIAAVSQVPVFGVSADLSPLLVAFVGLLCGSMPGAVVGFAVGLLVDLALVQTLGVTSLLLIAIGYWAGPPARAARPARR